ncbi:NACHT domain-containing protein [Streptomyces microflavus]|uniref:NACHT domain-containing protein n=1 Tax=Streptomyces microflavus TaxID=1919 RepID=UPI0036861445
MGPQLVLTALHVVMPQGQWAKQVVARVGHPHFGPDPVIREAQVCWPDQRSRTPAADALDVALLWLDTPVDTDGEAVRWGRPHGVVPVPFEGAGFPAFAAEDDGADAQFEYLRGELPAVSTASSGWVLDCPVWPAHRADGQRPWAGASGAAVFCRGQLVGVAVEDDRSMDWRRLHAVPIHRALAQHGFADLVRRHGHPGTTTSMKEVTAAQDPTGTPAAGVLPLPRPDAVQAHPSPAAPRSVAGVAHILVSVLAGCAIIAAFVNLKRILSGQFVIADALLVLVFTLLAWLVSRLLTKRGAGGGPDMSGEYSRWLPALRQAELRRITSDLRLRGIERFATDVPWTPAHELAAHSSPAMYGSDSGRNVRHLLNLWRNAQPARLLLSGPAGSGKSVALALLARQLLEEDDVSSPVPLVVSLAGWDAGTPFYSWIATRLAERYPAIVGEDSTVPAGELEQALQSDQVLLFLDSYDEIHVTARDTFLARLSEILSTDRPCLLASREEALQEATGSGHLVRGALAVHLEPLTARHFRKFLTAFNSQERWEPLLRAMENGTAPTLTRALETPLMHWLALKVFEFNRKNPLDLADVRQFPTAEEIQRHLLTSIVKAVFEPTAGHSDDHHFPARKAERWLTFLARHSSPADGSIRWWRLHKHGKAQLPALLAYSALFVAVIFMACTASRLTATALAAGGLWGALGGGAFTLAYGIARRSEADRRQTTKVSFRDDADLRDVIWRLVRLSPALCGALVVVSCTTGLSTPNQGREAGWMLGFGAVTTVACGSFGGSFAAFILTRTTHTDTGRSPRHAQSPHDLLERDKMTTAVVGLCMFAATFVAAAAAWASTDPKGLTPENSIAVFVITAAIAGAVTGPPLFTAWPVFRATHLYLCLRGHLPARHSAFLEAAHAGGILRTEGLTYQFRHVLMRASLL